MTENKSNARQPMGASFEGLVSEGDTVCVWLTGDDRLTVIVSGVDCDGDLDCRPSALSEESQICICVEDSTFFKIVKRAPPKHSTTIGGMEIVVQGPENVSVGGYEVPWDVLHALDALLGRPADISLGDALAALQGYRKVSISDGHLHVGCRSIALADAHTALAWIDDHVSA